VLQNWWFFKKCSSWKKFIFSKIPTILTNVILIDIYNIFDFKTEYFKTVLMRKNEVLVEKKWEKWNMKKKVNCQGKGEKEDKLCIIVIQEGNFKM